jgi:hypothetical protein
MLAGFTWDAPVEFAFQVSFYSFIGLSVIVVANAAIYEPPRNMIFVILFQVRTKTLGTPLAVFVMPLAEKMLFVHRHHHTNRLHLIHVCSGDRCLCCSANLGLR